MTAAEPGAEAGPETGGGPPPGSGQGSGSGSGSGPGPGPGPGPGQEGGPGPGQDGGPEAPSESAPASGSGAGAGPSTSGAAGSGAGVAAGANPGHTDRPHKFSASLSVVAGLLAILLVATGTGQVIAVGIALGGVTVLALGVEVAKRGHRLLGVVLATGGIVGVGAAIAWGVIGTASVEQRIEVLPGLLGLAVLTAGVTAAIRSYSRWFVSAGAGLLLLGVVVSGLVEDAPLVAMLAASAATYVAWDCGEHAINLGEQVGRQAHTWKAEFVHGLGAVAVGGIGVGMGLAFVNVGVSGVPLLGLATLLVAAVLLAAALST